MLPPQYISISSVVNQWLQQGLRQPRLLARFDQVINIAVDSATGPEVLALCSPGVGNGPLNIVLEPWPDWSALTAATPLAISGHCVGLGGCVIDCAAAPRWDPLPDWAAVRRALASDSLAELQRAAAVHRSRSPLLATVCGAPAPAAAAVFTAGLAQLESWWRSRDPSRLLAAAHTLAGLGPGLTPAGDDFLCGLMLGLWATQRSPQALCRSVAARAATLTTSLSGAFLRCAAAGQANAAWLALLQGLHSPVAGSCRERQLGEIVASGHSSGADTLAGFLWLCGSVARDRRGTRQCA